MTSKCHPVQRRQRISFVVFLWLPITIVGVWYLQPSHASYAPASSLSFVNPLLPLQLHRLRGGSQGKGNAFRWKKSATTPSTNTASTSDVSTAYRLSNQAGEEPTTVTSNDIRKPLAYNASATDASSIEIATLVKTLKTSFDYGLDDGEAKHRLQQYGLNSLDQPPGKSIFELIAEQFEDRLVQILLVVAAVSGIFSFMEVSAASATDAGESLWKSFVEPLVILAILVLNAAVGVWQSQSASDSLEALQQLQPTLCTVKRDGQWESEYPAAQLVPGDVIELRVGDKIPADARLIDLKSSSMNVDEGSLTGESVTVTKLPGDEGTFKWPEKSDSASPPPLQDQKGMLFSGTMVTSGSGTALVVQTGMDTQFGKIQQGVTDAKAEEPKTPLAIKLDEFGETLTVIIGVICLAVWVVSIPKMNDASFATVWEGAIYYAKVAVALGVAAIPEGLPAVITLCLSLGTRRMVERNVIVRKLPSVETLGCTSVICTDKTGTLTTNEMTAVSLVLLEKEILEDGKKKNVRRYVLNEHVIEGTSYSPIGIVDGIIANDEVKINPDGAVADVAAVAALCNDAKVIGSDEDFKVDSDNLDYSDDEDIVDKDGTTIGHRHSPSHLNGDSQPKKSEKDTKKVVDKKIYSRVGEPTEAALCVLSEKLGGMSHYMDSPSHFNKYGYHLHVPPSVLASANVDSWREAFPRSATLEFNRDRKSMSVLCNFADHKNIQKQRTAQQQNFSSDAEKSNVSGMSRSKKTKNRLLVKGAPNLLLDRCTFVKTRDGSVLKLTGPLRKSIQQKVTDLAQRPLRCLALAVKENDNLEGSLKRFCPTNEGDLTRHPLLKDPSNYKNIESGLTLVGFVGIKDPARPEVADSILECSKAGIRVIMITGDARDTAVAIARDVNIFPKEDDKSETNEKPIKAYEGREFFLKSDEEQLELLKEDNLVFCRAEPADKQKLVKMLQSLHEIPAMTGDGVNDAPALQQAAIGVAMGTGTEVAKEAADMVLADDNFSTIVNAVEEGRRIYANMQAFICFLISCNIGEICAIFFATLAGFPEPLTAMHLLWVNLVTDGPPATALGFNPPAPDLMEQPPRPSDEPIMTKWLLTRYVLTGLYVGLATIGVFAQHYLNLGISATELANWSECGSVWIPEGGAQMCEDLFQGSGRMLPQSLALTTLVCMEMFKALSAVSVDSSLLRVGPQSNPWLLLGVAGPFMLHMLVLYSAHVGLPGLGESFGMVPLSWENWKTVLMFSTPIFLVDEVLKAVGRRLAQKDGKKVALATYEG